MTEELFDVVEVFIRPPGGEVVMGTGLTKDNAEAFIKMAVIRRGVENSFYKTRPHR